MVAPGPGRSGPLLFLPAVSELLVTFGPWSWCLRGIRRIPARCLPLPNPGAVVMWERRPANPALASIPGLGKLELPGATPAFAPRTPRWRRSAAAWVSSPRRDILKHGMNQGARLEFPSPEFPDWPPPLASKVASQGPGANKHTGSSSNSATLLFPFPAPPRGVHPCPHPRIPSLRPPKWLLRRQGPVLPNECPLPARQGD